MEIRHRTWFAVVIRLVLIGLLGCEIPPSDPDPVDPIDPDPTDPLAASAPCQARPGAPKPWEGVLCNGNLMLEVALSVNGIGLTYNSVDSSHQEGFGYGWRLSVRSVLEKDELGNVVITRPDGTPVQFDFDGSGYRAEPQTLSRLTRDDQGNFTETLRGGTRKIYVAFAGRHRLHQIIDRNGNTTTINHDGLGRETGLSDPYGRITTFSYNGDFLQALTDSAGRTFMLGYNQAGELESVTQPAVEAGTPVTRFAYDDGGRHLVVSRQTPAGLTTLYEYFRGGELKSMTDPAGYGMAVEYTDTSVTQTYSMGEQAHQQFADGQLMAENNELGMFFYYNRDARHRVTMITDSLGHSWEMAYNDSDDLVWEKNPLGTDTVIEYDSNHNGTGVTTQGLNYSYQYDRFNGLTQATDPMGHTTQYQRDERGNLVRIVDYTGVTRSQASYNADGSLSSITNMYGDTMRFTYDDYGNLTSLSHPDMGTVEMQSTPMGLLEEQISGLGMKTDLSYDARAALTEYAYSGFSTKQGGGTAVSLVRDLDNRVIGYQICGPDGCDTGGRELSPSGNPTREQKNGNDVQDGECPCVDPPAP